ncbi:uncharacterized protein TNIN_257621 [Trichonephila inaurata madagascariensis]|uniref:Uncharacterized protein n=1 Tax=Trichonephila inaurata madagascariensis TaxID=2747483 RepID=A0A8X6XB63_9ARAC|nr:uncharacterized protein TNIN_257621 [Trichonephila inaurata madagascariensis]
MGKVPKKGRKMFQKRKSSGTVTSFKKLQLSLLNTDILRKACTGRASATLLPKKPIDLARFPEYMEMTRKYDVILRTEFQGIVSDIVRRLLLVSKNNRNRLEIVSGRRQLADVGANSNCQEFRQITGCPRVVLSASYKTNNIMSKLRNRLIDENLESCLKLKTIPYKPDLPLLSKEMQGQCSH